jgi:hypothetical protein
MPGEVVEEVAPRLTDEQRRLQHLIHNLLNTLDAVVPDNVAHVAVEEARRALAQLDRKVATVGTAPPRTWTFCGHWKGSSLVVDYVLAGDLWDDREDSEGVFPDGLWAASGSGDTVEEAEANAKAEYFDEDGQPYA